MYKGVGKMNKIRIQLDDNKYLVAEIYPFSEYKEITLYLSDSDNVVIQDLAMVREKYTYDGDLNVLREIGKYEVLVWANEYSEDYTDRFVINEYGGGEDE